MNLLNNLTPPGHKRSCKVATILGQLNTNDQQTLTDALANNDWPIKSLARELQKRGVMISESPLANHRNKACICWKI